MNFQEKLLETSAGLRSRAQLFATTALARLQADIAAKSIEKRLEALKGSLAVFNTAGLELNKVARRHAIRFVKQNSTLASQVRDDVSALARSTFTTLTSAPAKKTRKPAGKRARKAAARAN
jgi:Zn-dependent oligopeptidase